MPAYIDASALAALILPESRTPWAQTTILGYAEGRVVSDFAVAEVISAVSRRVRMRTLTAMAAEHVLVRFEAWVANDAMTMTTTGSDIVEAGRLVRRFELGLRTPDALHLVLTRRCGAVLMTLDAKMAQAATALDIATLPLPP